MVEDDVFAKLEAEFCPPLDPALFQAIVSDYDLSQDDSLQAARATLEPLKDSAQFEEAAGFDPSGTGGGQGAEGLPRVEHLDPGQDDTSVDTSRETDLTSLSNGFSSMDLEREWMRRDGPEIAGSAEDLEKMDVETKVLLLQDIFGDALSKYTIRHTLEKCQGRWNSALDELMNHVYFEEEEDSESGTKTPSKGIDAFAEDQVVHNSKRKKKTKQKQRKRVFESGSPVSSNIDQTAPSNKWHDAEKDVDFIAERTDISRKTISSAYNENGASVSRTIGVLLKAHITSNSTTIDETTEQIFAQAREMGRVFPIIAPNYLIALVRIASPSTTAAHELARALTASPRERSSGNAQLIPQYTPATILLDGDDEFVHEQSSASLGNGTLAPQYAAARAQAFDQARAAHRKAKSDHLMGGVAAYYGQVGRDSSALLHNATAAAADDLASAQSTPTQLDLHGVDVLNAVRIADSKVQQWWNGLGENRVNGRIGAIDRQTGYRIVVGLGRHSEGGKGKLGPAVMKMLKSKGWRFEHSGAVIVVIGKAK